MLERLPKTMRVLNDLVNQTDQKHMERLDKALEQAVMKAWCEVHGTGLRRPLGREGRKPR
jgi:hypothetical protein